MADFVFNEREFWQTIEGASQELLEAMAYQTEANAKAHVVRNNQVDTGFMLNTIYTITRQGSGYGQTDKNGAYKSKKTGQMVQQEKAPEAKLVEGAGAATVAGASYAIFQEQRNSFLYAGLVDTQNQFERKNGEVEF